MKPIQHRQRNFADQDFQQSLNQLEDIVQDNSMSDTNSSISQENSENTCIIDLAAWEEAVADIEQYLQQKTHKSKN
jgi:tRNA A58 N-methylase Trm61